MGKHSLQRESKLPNSVKGALVMGTLAATTGTMPAIANAATTTIDVPGVGKFDVEVPDQYAAQAEQLIPQLNQALSAAPQAMPSAPALPNFAPPAPAQQQTAGDVALDAAKTKVGAMYSWGAAGPYNFDCSGLVQWSFEKAGRSVGRTTHDQYRKGSGVKRSRLRKGDMVFFYSGPSHVGIALGDGRMVHAPSSGKKIQVVRMADYFDAHFTGARRIS